MHGTPSLLAQVCRLSIRSEISADTPLIVLPGPSLAISAEELKLVGKDSTADATVRIPDEFGGGYYATLEVFHQLHCLVCLLLVAR